MRIAAALAFMLAAAAALWFRSGPVSERDALARDPASPYRWADLGCRRCFDRAVELGPNIPPILMRAANFYFGAGDTAAALGCTRKILSLVREYDAAIFTSYTRWEVPPGEILAHGFPPDREARQAYFRYVLGAGNVAGAARVWNWLGTREDAGIYYDFLLDHREYRAAAALGRIPWDVRPIKFDHAGNIAYSRVLGRVVVAAPDRYTFRAFIRTEGLTTDQGLRFRIVDAESPARLDVSTDQATGTTDWHALAAAIAIGPHTRLLRIEITRHTSLKFDNNLSGTAWIDGIELVPGPLIQ